MGLLVIVAVIAVGAIATGGKKKTAATTPVTQSAPAASTTPSSTNASTYKDGTYTATSHYDNPGGDSGLGVSITLKNGAITDSTVTPEATNSQSKEYQEMFVSGYKSLIIGKQIDTVSLSRVSGSSLTSQGFNAALAQIKSQAKA